MLNVETFVSEILQSLCLQGIAEESGGDEGNLTPDYSLTHDYLHI